MFARGRGLGDDFFELGKIHGLGEMGGETGGAALLDVFFLAETAQRDAGKEIAGGAEGAHEIEAGAVGETEIAEEQIEGSLGGEAQGGGDVRGGLNLVALGGEKAGHDAGGVAMIFHQQDAQRAGGRRRSGGGSGRRDGGG